ncbi:hypothetical protein ACM01_20225 [Streptomyces viridochromogenes]|uniref:Uncharacterized protein n=1 Tax=Streptomyces viridochromogenes TaxID=1938 RepID=A0A0J7ZD44_STRVR|nr:hypothetical protein ACM01_20225 [Streptomyces viridochromogenes]KOG07761.1 hypothetical protein ADK36_44480 [Streptomyces viridochromogenes]KOG24094.1 hypothetical protein ADK35_11685 [Streptomyces viridochromogenes]
MSTDSSDLPQPLRILGSGLRRLPGAEQVSRAADGALDRLGAVSPRGRRIAVYTGAGVLGVAGVVEWPLALTGAAVAWLTQPRPQQGARGETAQDDRTEADIAQDDMARAHGRPGVVGSGDAPAGTADALSESHGPGGRLAPSHFQHDRPDSGRHDQPAKVGDPATTSALKKVAEATAHHGGP